MTTPHSMEEKLRPGMLLLKYIAVANLAVAQPLYEVLQQSPELFTTHRTSGIEVILFTLVLSLGIALLPVIAVAVIARTSRRAAVLFDFLLLGSFLSLLTLYLLKQTNLTDSWLLPMSVLLGAVAWLALYRIQILQMWVQFLAIAGLALPVMFLMNENIRPLIEITRIQHGFTGRLKPNPVVFIIFDQLPTAALIDGSGNIDRERYPNFAALTDVAHWFRNNTSTAQDTVSSVPAILTGTYIKEKKAANITIFPNNMFTFLSGSFEQNLSQHATDMGTDRERGGSQFFVLFEDVFLVYLHIVLPERFTRRLPSLEDRIANFWVQQDVSSIDVTELSTTRFQEFTANIGDGDNWLHYLHIDIPHGPYRFHPSGNRYTWQSSVPGLAAAWGFWGVDEMPIRKAQQRFLAQVQLADHYLGEIVKRMQQQGIFERALMVVTSDHGVSFRREGHTRAAVGDNYTDILYVPLMIKLPHQTSGEISDDNVETIDIFPTVIDLLGGDVLWAIDGISVFAENRKKGAKRAFTSRAEVNGLYEFESDKGGEFHKLEPMSDMFIWDTDSRWNRLQHARDDLLGKHIDAVPEEFYPLAPGAKGFVSDENLDVVQAFFELNAGWIRGEASVPQELAGPADLAIVVSGKVVAMTSTFAHLDASHYFAELLPEGISKAENVQVFVLRP